MRRKLFKYIMVALCMLFSLSVDTHAAYEEPLDICRYEQVKAGADSLQNFADTFLSDNAGIMSEWYILGLNQLDESIDFSVYLRKLNKYVESNTGIAAATLQKYALAMIACGDRDNPYICDTVDDTIGKQGIMSYVFGLHLLNNGYETDQFKSEDVIQKILALMLDSGGWSLSGKGDADVDITAMTIQALAPHYDSIKEAVDNALLYLSEVQLPSGGYMAYGKENAESAAQVLIALCSLGIDADKDERYIKEHSVTDALRSYRLQDGSFCHVKDGGYNFNATSQAFFAFAAYCKNGKNIYVFDKKTEIVTSAPVPTVVNTQSTEEPIKERNMSYKVWACVAVAVVCVIVLILLKCLKKNNRINIIFVLCTAVLIITLILVTNIQSKKAYYTETKKDNIIGNVSISIVFDDKDILPNTVFDISEGDSVYDILIEAAKKYNIIVDSDAVSYISGIDHIYEKQYGELSGWTYTVNGKFASVGCSEYKLKDGDVIVWRYARTWEG